MIPRSWLYVPGSDAARLAKAASRGADAIIADLEDAVAPSAKVAARSVVASWVASVPGAWVRINSGALGPADVAAVVGPGLAGVCVPKASVAALSSVAAALAEAEAACGLPVGTVAVCPLIESAAGLEALSAIARSPRVTRLQLGEVDLAADLGVTLSASEVELLAVRTAVVVASRAAGLAPPMAPASPDFRDLAAFRTSTAALGRLGFRGRACIHPAQVTVANEVFTPSESDLAAARDLLERHAAAVASDVGATVDAAGRLVDEATVRSARELLALALRE